MDRKGQLVLVQLEGTEQERQDVAQPVATEYRTAEEDNMPTMEQAWDDVTGADFNPNVVKSARQEEAQYIRKMGLHKKVPVLECWGKFWQASIKARWVGICKGDVKQPNYRSRLVAKELNTPKRMDSFAATPSLDAIKLILSMAATLNRGEGVMVNDV